MATGPVEGNADMYGIGIRLGFYLNCEIETSRYAFSCFIAATFIALIVQTTTAQHPLTAVDIYAVLLLCFGYFYFLVPTFLWRLLTGLLLLAVAAFQLWFWATVTWTRTGARARTRYGFLFARFDMASATFRGREPGLPWKVLIMLICLAILGAHVMGMRGTDIRALLRTSHAILLLAVAELTIAWNGIALDSAGQLIPFLVSSGSASWAALLYVAGGAKERDAGGGGGGGGEAASNPVNALYMPLPLPQPPPSLPVGVWTMPVAQTLYHPPDGRAAGR
ncbi:hypothetical protein F4775DRAFT_606132 [Biscogniauxia sp. FL1348]|nr:hypothetical protein F4775DRAFT_606132 [Biscogniauxia sp. FL1348]